MAGQGGGGAWKVAYADFVTAMMALFIVMWIIAPDPNDNKIVFEDEIDTAPPDADGHMNFPRSNRLA